MENSIFVGANLRVLPHSAHTLREAESPECERSECIEGWLKTRRAIRSFGPTFHISLCQSILLLLFCVGLFGSHSQADSTTVGDVIGKIDQKARSLIEKVEGISDKITPEYAQEKKLALRKKYPTLEKDYLDFIDSKHPSLRKELRAVFEKYPEEMEKHAIYVEGGQPLIGFQLIEDMCVENKDCRDDVGDLLTEKYPNLAKESARYVLDNKTELLIELTIITFEVLIKERDEKDPSEGLSLN